MSERHFPATVPVDCVRDLVALYREGIDRSNMQDAADHALWTIGCFNALVDLDGPSPIGDCCDDEECDCLLELAEVLEVPVPAEGPITNMLIERLIAVLVPMLLEQLQKWLEEWLQQKDE